MFRSTSATFRALLVPAACIGFLLCPGSLPARVNLPQIKARTQLKSTAAVEARDFFAGASQNESLPAPLEQVFIESLPQEMTAACQEMIEHWGLIAKGSLTWRVRVLHAEGQSAWLAFRCGSRVPNYAENFDERLALLRLDNSSLTFVPTGPNREDDSTLYQLRYKDTYKTPGGDAVAFRVSSTTDNPCCDGGDQENGTRLVLLTVTSGVPAEVLNVVVTRKEYSHDDVDGDSERDYTAKVHFERDAAGNVVSVTSEFREVTKDYDLEGKLRKEQRAPRVGTETFRWNPESRRFVKASKRE